MSLRTQKQLEKWLKHFPVIQKAKDGKMSPEELERQLRGAGASFPEIPQMIAEYNRSSPG